MSSGHVECGGIGDRSPADEALTDVHGGLAVDEPLALEQRTTSSAGPTATTARGSNEASAARATGASTAPAIAISCGGLARGRGRRASTRTPRERGEGRARPGGKRTPLGVRARRHPRSCRGAEATHASIELPEGIGVSRSWRGHALVGVCRREEETAALLVGEELDREQREPVSLEEPADLAGRDMQLEQPICDIRVVVEVPAATCPFVTRERTSLPFSEAAEQEIAHAAGNRFRSLRVRGGRRPRRSPPARARSTMRAPCRRGRAAGRTLGEQALTERRARAPRAR